MSTIYIPHLVFSIHPYLLKSKLFFVKSKLRTNLLEITYTEYPQKSIL